MNETKQVNVITFTFGGETSTRVFCSWACCDQWERIWAACVWPDFESHVVDDYEFEDWCVMCQKKVAWDVKRVLDRLGTSLTEGESE